MPKGQQSLVTWATPRLSEDKVKKCVDPKLNNDYPPKAIAKLHHLLQQYHLSTKLIFLSFKTAGTTLCYHSFLGGAVDFMWHQLIGRARKVFGCGVLRLGGQLLMEKLYRPNLDFLEENDDEVDLT